MHHQLKEAGFVLTTYEMTMTNGMPLTTYAYPLFEFYNLDTGQYMQYFLQWDNPWVSNPDSFQYGDHYLYLVGGVGSTIGGVLDVPPAFEYVVYDPDSEFCGQYNPERTPGIRLDTYFNDSQVKEEDGTWIFKCDDFFFTNSTKGGLVLIPTRNGSFITIENDGTITAYENNAKYFGTTITPAAVPKDSITEDDLCVFSGTSFIRDNIFYNSDVLYTSSFDVEEERYLFAKEVIVGNQKFIHCTQNIWLNEGPVEMIGYKSFLRPEKQRLYAQEEVPKNLADVKLDYDEITSWKASANDTNAEDDMNDLFDKVEAIYNACSENYDIVVDPNSALGSVTQATDESFEQVSRADGYLDDARELADDWDLVLVEVTTARSLAPSNAETAENYASAAEEWNEVAQATETTAKRALEIIEEIAEHTSEARIAANLCALQSDASEAEEISYRKALDIIEKSSLYLKNAKEAAEEVEDLARTLALTIEAEEPEPATDPEDPTTDPEDPTTDPEDPTTDPEENPEENPEETP
mgnify:CR=1 FL=1